MSELSAGTHQQISAAAPGSAAVKPRRHLWEVDVVRIVTFLCVIGVHTVSHTTAASDVPLYLLLGLLHFTRNVFFALTTFVLVFTYNIRPVPMKKFWPRRFLLVGIPYVVWSVIYYSLGQSVAHSHQTFAGFLLQLLIHVLDGTAWYHLYFLLVTMQVYLLMPLLVWLVRKTRGHHWLLLGIVGALQLGIVTCYFYFPKTVAWAHGFTTEAFISYIFFIVAGAVAADHVDDFLDWVRGHRRLIGIVVGSVGIVTLGVFLLQIHLGDSYNTSGLPMQPIMMVWATAVAFGLLALGTIWADHRSERATRFVTWASDRSFGIFLTHPLFIWIGVTLGGAWFVTIVPKPWFTLVMYILVILCAAGLTQLLRKLPVSVAFTGRPWERRKPAPPAPPSGPHAEVEPTPAAH